MNKNPTKNSNGKFVKKETIVIEPVLVTGNGIIDIKKLQQELIEGYFDLEKVRKAYRQIVNLREDELLPNVFVIKKAIMAFGNN